MPIYETLIKPLKHRTDLIIPNNDNFDKALNMLTLSLKGKLTELKGNITP
jgi:uridine kinase